MRERLMPGGDVKFEDPGGGYTALLDKCAALAAENELLKSVAEAATRFVGDVGCFIEHELPMALAAWRASQVKG